MPCDHHAPCSIRSNFAFHLSEEQDGHGFILVVQPAEWEYQLVPYTAVPDPSPLPPYKPQQDDCGSRHEGNEASELRVRLAMPHDVSLFHLGYTTTANHGVCHLVRVLSLFVGGNGCLDEGETLSHFPWAQLFVNPWHCWDRQQGRLGKYALTCSTLLEHKRDGFCVSSRDGRTDHLLLSHLHCMLVYLAAFTFHLHQCVTLNTNGQ